MNKADECTLPFETFLSAIVKSYEINFPYQKTVRKYLIGY